MSHADGPDRRSILRLGAAALLLGTSVAPSAARATTVIAMDLAELARESDALVQAVVGDRSPVQMPRGVYTDSALAIERVIGGTAPAALTVRQLGGTLGGQTQRVPGDARIASGQRIVAFVRQVDGRWYFTALAQSVWHVTGDGPGARVERNLQGLTLFRRDTSGRVVPTDESLAEPATLGELSAVGASLAFGERPPVTP